VSGDGYEAGCEYPPSQDVADELLLDEIELLLRIKNAVSYRAGAGASREERCDAAKELLGEDDVFVELVDRLEALSDAGHTQLLDRPIAGSGGEAETGSGSARRYPRIWV